METIFETRGDDVQRHGQTFSDELKIIQLKCEEIDLRTRAEENRRQVWEQCLEDRMRAADWNTYTEELAAASQEIKAWRLNIEDERENFVSRLKLELQDTLLQHIDQRIEQKCDMMNVVANGAIESAASDARLHGTGEDFKRLEQRLNQVSTALHDEIEGLNAIWQNEIKSISTKLAERNADGKASDAEGGTAPTVEWTLQQLSMRILELRQDAKAYAMAEDVNKLVEQVKESHPLLFDMGLRLTELENELEAERETRNAATEDLARRRDLVATVFNSGTSDKSEKSEKTIPVSAAEDAMDLNERHERHLKLVLEQVENMAKSQLSAIREQLEQEQVARKGDVQLLWSNLNTMKHSRQVPSLSAVPPVSAASLSAAPPVTADRRKSWGADDGLTPTLSAVPPLTSERRASWGADDGYGFSSRVAPDSSRAEPFPSRSISPSGEGGRLSMAELQRQRGMQQTPQSVRAGHGGSMQVPLGGSTKLPLRQSYANHSPPPPVARHQPLTVGDQEGSFSNSSSLQDPRRFSFNTQARSPHLGTAHPS